MREHVRNTKPVQALNPAVRTGSATGSAIDRLGYEAVSILVTTGAYTDGTHTVVLEESDDGTTYTTITAGNLTAVAPVVDGAGKANTATLIGYMGDARYARIKSNVSGSPVTGAAVGAVALLSRAAVRPVGKGLA